RIARRLAQAPRDLVRLHHWILTPLATWMTQAHAPLCQQTFAFVASAVPASAQRGALLAARVLLGGAARGGADRRGSPRNRRKRWLCRRHGLDCGSALEMFAKCGVWLCAPATPWQPRTMLKDRGIAGPSRTPRPVRVSPRK